LDAFHRHESKPKAQAESRPDLSGARALAAGNPANTPEAIAFFLGGA
jgi:hypothetical protein